MSDKQETLKTEPQEGKLEYINGMWLKHSVWGICPGWLLGVDGGEVDVSEKKHVTHPMRLACGMGCPEVVSGVTYIWAVIAEEELRARWRYDSKIPFLPPGILKSNWIAML